MQGGKYLAEERGAFDQVEALPVAVSPERDTPVATAPLYEIAAVHDGQPPASWLSMLYRRWRGEAA